MVKKYSKILLVYRDSWMQLSALKEKVFCCALPEIQEDFVQSDTKMLTVDTGIVSILFEYGINPTDSVII